MALKKLIAGNWKMHGVAADLTEVKAIAEASSAYPEVDVALCVPAILIERAVRAVPDFAIGGQDVHFEDSGARTGGISAAMLADAGAVLTIVGHSERREAQRESDEDVKAKAEAALACGLNVVLCVGESLEARELGGAVDIVIKQLDSSLPERIDGAAELAVAYEPIWAIGTGRTAGGEDIAEMHAAVRGRLAERYKSAGERVRILYGGSVKGSNAADIFAIRDVDGALVGGASLKAANFMPIVAAAAASAVEGEPAIA
jgi:triosephosphate isomerase